MSEQFGSKLSEATSKVLYKGTDQLKNQFDEKMHSRLHSILTMALGFNEIRKETTKIKRENRWAKTEAENHSRIRHLTYMVRNQGYEEGYYQPNATVKKNKKSSKSLKEE